MCGISGIISYKHYEEPLSVQIAEMTSVLKHRGPNSEGYMLIERDGKNIIKAGGCDTPKDVWDSRIPYSPGTAIEDQRGSYAMALGHRRLSIIDLSAAGHQPMCTAEGNHWIIYNGEIYNYLELRQELAGLGYKFLSNTDTEVILQAYVHWGGDMLQKLDGMWSFVIFDRKEEMLFGSRDRFGVKPLYYYSSNDCFVFASELKALKACGLVQTGVDEEIVFDYLSHSKVEHSSKSIFQNLTELPPAHAFKVYLSQPGIQTFKYYHLRYAPNDFGFGEDRVNESIEKITHLLKDSIKMRLRSDVELGCCLSGGIDSSVLTCMVAHLLGKDNSENSTQKLKAFSSIFKEKGIDESIWVNEVVNNCDVQSFTTGAGLDNSSMNLLEDLVYFQDIPFFNFSTYAQYNLMKLIGEQGIKVTLDGQGGDEIFAGYPLHAFSYLNDLLRNLQFKRWLQEYKAMDKSLVDANAYFEYNLKSRIPMQFEKKIKMHFKPTQGYLNPQFRNTWESESAGNSTQPMEVNHALANDLTGNVFKVLMRTADRNSMRFSVEARMPFADSIGLIEYLFNLPGNIKIRNGYTKFLLRESARDYLPGKIRFRKDKIGFEAPGNKWLIRNQDSLSEAISGIDDYVNTVKLKNNWKKIAEYGTDGGTGFLWRVVNLAIWKRKYKI